MGITNEQEILVVDRRRAFRIHEYLVVEDPELAAAGPVVGEVVETQSYNQFLPFDPERGPADAAPFLTLTATTGHDLDQHMVYWAKVRLLGRLPRPVRPGTAVREPHFAEVRRLLLKGDPRRSMILGEIHATDHLSAGMDADLQGRLLVLEEQPRPQAGVPFAFDPREMAQYPHIGIFGGSGSGKSFGMRVLLEELMKRQIPTLVLDPHYEMSFAVTTPAHRPGIDYLQRHQVLRVGIDVGVKFTDLGSRDLSNLLGAAAALSEQMIGVVEATHRKGDSYTTYAGRMDDLAEALEAGKERLEKRLRDASGPEREVLLRKLTLLEDYRSLPPASVNGVAWRLRRLQGHGLFNHDIKPVETALRNGKLAVIQGPIWLLQVFASYVINNLYRQRRDYKDASFLGEQKEYFPPFVIATDEAHNFAPKGFEAPAKGVIKEIAQEGRKYGVFLVLATQRPTLLDETVTAQLNTKCVFRTVRATDIDTIKQETDLTPEEARRLPFLRSGDAFISSAIYGRTIPVRIRMAETASPHGENPFDELRQEVEQGDEELLAALLPFLPVKPSDKAVILQRLAKAGRKMTLAELEAGLEGLVLSGRLRKKADFFGDEYELA